MTFIPEGPDWNVLRSMIGGAAFVPGAVSRMINATTIEDASKAYWELDNRVVVQQQLFESAVWTAILVSDAICNEMPSDVGMRRALDLLVEIAEGEPDQSELALGNRDLGDVCRRELSRFLPCFRGLATNDDEHIVLGALDLLDILEVDRQRLRELAEAVLRRDAGPAPKARAREILDSD
ncbi:hypothetical protein AB0E69_10415 [Kribbella sp. NPDC026611]|uniref:hypothetical protein n=1 Tax=Kribbella sp. NPDC026611 TaxID=3154911 RepID=UPI0034079664